MTKNAKFFYTEILAAARYAYYEADNQQEREDCIEIARRAWLGRNGKHYTKRKQDRTILPSDKFFGKFLELTVGD